MFRFLMTGVCFYAFWLTYSDVSDYFETEPVLTTSVKSEYKTDNYDVLTDHLVSQEKLKREALKTETLANKTINHMDGALQPADAAIYARTGG